jgi:apolipoprotein D and lipocalin family protein
VTKSTQILRLTLVLITFAWLTACASSFTDKNQLPALVAAEKVDLDRYYGRWFVIANIPYSAEKGKVGTYVEYNLRPDGKIDDLYFFRKGDFSKPIKQWTGIAWVLDRTSNAVWKAQFIWPISFDYIILATATDYSWAIVGHPSRDLAWIFDRDAKMPEPLYQELLGKLQAQGYDAARLKRVPQAAEDIGQPGFQ